MGLCESAEVKEQKQRSKEIDKELTKHPPKLIQKLLLLGNFLDFC